MVVYLLDNAHIPNLIITPDSTTLSTRVFTCYLNFIVATTKAQLCKDTLLKGR